MTSIGLRNGGRKQGRWDFVHDGHGSCGRGAPWRHGSCSLGATAAEYPRQSRCDGGRRINDGKAAAASKLGVVEGTRNADQIHNTIEKESNQKWQLPPLRYILLAGRFRLAPLANRKLEGRDSRQQLAFKSNEEVAVQVRTIPLDEVIPDSQPVLVLKIDVQGWEYHVLKRSLKAAIQKKG
ncbi:hypothetical protein LINPERHAP2_LOCUS37084 [Linum perenne]